LTVKFGLMVRPDRPVLTALCFGRPHFRTSDYGRASGRDKW
jgi:hypothetical protein